MKKNGAIIFSRIGSTRLPRKALLKINEIPLLLRVVELSKLIKLDGPIILATTSLVEDDPLEDIARENNIQIFRGESNNVLKRAIDACNFYDLDGFVRICGDRVFFDPHEISRYIHVFNENDYDLVTNFHNQKIIPGLTIEVIKSDALKSIFSLKLSSEYLEHITKFFYENNNKFKIKNILSRYAYQKNLSLTVDTADDLSKAEFIAKQLSRYGYQSYNIGEVMKYAKQWSAMRR